MTDERDKEQVVQPGGESPAAGTPPEIDSLEAAFAAIEARDAADAEGGKSGADAGPEPGIDGTVAPADGDTPVSGDAAVVSDDAGGHVPGAGLDGSSDDGDLTVDVEATVTSITKLVEQRAITEVAEMFLNHKDDSGNLLIRQTNGRLGATINDPDIYRVDKTTGVATFYNPDTGKPFTGDNPRAQAKLWVEGYNEDMRNEFNTRAEAYQAQLMEQQKPVIELLKFTPTYEKLDPVRQKMFDALIEGHEVEDENGDHIGYDVDLNQTLAQVNRQVEFIKSSQQAAAPAVEAAPTGPALDMPNTGSGVTGAKPEFKSQAEAMEWAQDQILAKGKK